MALLTLVRNWWTAPSPRELEALVNNIVDRCEPAAWDRASDRAMTMSPAEACGYIRARTAAVAHLQVDRALQLRSRTEPEFHAMLLNWVQRDLVRRIHRRLLNVRHPIVERRKAA